MYPSVQVLTYLSQTDMPTPITRTSLFLMFGVLGGILLLFFLSQILIEYFVRKM